MAGITLTSKTINSTYDSLLKLTDNDGLTASFKTITDGLGNDSGISINNAGNVQISGTLNVSGTTTIGSVLRGNATLTIDPAAHGDNTGLVVIAGDLQVDGTTTTINSTTVSLDDKNILLAADAANKAAANGAGITVETGTNDPVVTDATILYNGTDDTWDFNKWVTASKFVGDLTGDVTGTVSSLSNHDTDDLSEGTSNLYYTTARFNTNFDSKDTDDLDEGSSNLYFTDTRARGAFSAGTGVTITNGQISIGQSVGTGDSPTFNTVNSGKLRLTSTTDASVSSTGHAFQIGSSSSTNVIMDNNEIMARNNGAVSGLHLNPDGGDVTIHNNTTAGNFTIGGNDVYHEGNLTKSVIDALNVDADTLDGFSTTSASNFWGVIPKVGTDGVIEIGKYIDFHESDADTDDNDYRLTVSAGTLYGNGGFSVGSNTIIGGTIKGSNWFVSDENTSIAGLTRDWVHLGAYSSDASRAAAVQIGDIDGARYAMAGGGYDLLFMKHLATSDTWANVMKLEASSADDNSVDVRIYQNLYVEGNQDITGNLDVGGTLSVTGTIDLSNANLDIGAADIIFDTDSTLANRGLVWDVDGSYLSKLVSGGTNGGIVEIYNNMDGAITGGSDVFRIKQGSSASVALAIKGNGNVEIPEELYIGDGNIRCNNTIDHLTTSGAAQIGRFKSIQVSTTYSGTAPDNGILFYNDTNLYRSSANVLKTDDSFQVGTNFDSLGHVQAYGVLYTRNNLRVLNAAGTDWNTWATRSNGNYNLNVGSVTASRIISTNISDTPDIVGNIPFIRSHSGDGNDYLSSIDSLGTYIVSKTDGGYGGGTKPSGSHNGVGIISMQTHTGDYYTQLALDTKQNSLWIRSANAATTFGGWNRIYSDGYRPYADNAGTLDGIDSSQFLRSDTSDTMSGNLTFSGDSRYIDLSGGTTNSQNALIIGEQNLYGVRFRWDSGASLHFDGYWNTSTTGAENRDLGYVDVNNRIWYLNNSIQSNYIYVGSGGGYFYNDSGSRIRTNHDFYTNNGNTYLYSNNLYLGDSSGDNVHVRGNYISGYNWYIGTDGGARFKNIDISGSLSDTIQNKTAGGNLWLQYGHNGTIGLGYGGGKTTMYAKAEVIGTANGNDPTLKITSTTSNSYNHAIECFNSNLTSGEANIVLFGKEGNTKNSGYIGYEWAGAGSNNNFVTIGHWGADHLFRVYPDQTTTGTSFRAPIFYDVNNTGYYLHGDGTSRLNILNVNAVGTSVGGIGKVMFPYGAEYNSGSTTGAIKITLPQSWTNTMMTMKITIFDYSINESIEVHCGGYNYAGGGGYWVNTHAKIIANPHIDRNYNVRFGHDGSKCCILIGETNTAWAYPKVVVTEWVGGHSNETFSNWDNGWDISIVTTLPSNIDQTRSDNQIGRTTDSLQLPYYNGGTMYLRKNSHWDSVSGIDVIGGAGEFRFSSNTGNLNVRADGWIHAHDNMKAPIFYDSNNTGYYVNPASTSRLAELNVTHFGVVNTSQTSRDGISLYNGYTGGEPTYGILFTGTTGFGGHGAVTSDWATYFTMNNNNSRGWIFRRVGSGNCASISGGGTASFNGDVIAYYSDMRLKTKLGDIEDPIGKIQALNGFYYEPNEVAESYGYEKERRVGLSAQEVEAVLPEIVTDAPIGDGYKTVDYAKLVPVLVEAIKEQQKQIDELKSLINKS